MPKQLMIPIETFKESMPKELLIPIGPFKKSMPKERIVLIETFKQELMIPNETFAIFKCGYIICKP